MICTALLVHFLLSIPSLSHIDPCVFRHTQNRSFNCGSPSPILWIRRGFLVFLLVRIGVTFLLSFYFPWIPAGFPGVVSPMFPVHLIRARNPSSRVFSRSLPCVHCEFPRAFLMHSLLVPQFLFSSDTSDIHFLRIVQFISVTFPVRSAGVLSCFHVSLCYPMNSLVVTVSLRVPVIFAVPSLFVSPRASHALNVNISLYITAQSSR